MGADGEKADLLALEGAALADGVAGSEDILYGVGGGSEGGGVCAGGYVGAAWRDEGMASLILQHV